DRWLAPMLAQKNLRIILTGAGTSAYVGKSLAPHLTAAMSRKVEAISTTKLVSNPGEHFLNHVPTLLISYARSGNSPESVAAIELANQLVDNCYHLLITCNKNGRLAQQQSRAYCLLMPDATNDQSFAMTSSFTAMMLSTLCLFTPNPAQLDSMVEATVHLLEHTLPQIKQLAQVPFKRAVFLGSGGLKGIATEASLKMVELTAGKIDCYVESPMGFRHGPKSLVNEDTLIIVLSSKDDYLSKYEDDLIEELVNDHQTGHIYALYQGLNDVWSSFPYIVYCQALAFYKALALNIPPDNPCPSGEVNRVVQGVTIYPYQTDVVEESA
ncbi:MAG: SIS domain-containing protein, partial [Algicola sp.]|nr:SIS domain-containing protein [Algicola sp.]